MKTVSLSELVVPQKAVHVSDDSSVLVRGLSFDDLIRLSVAHLPNLAMLYKAFTERQSDLTPAAMQDLLELAMTDAPALIYDAIASAADEPQMAKQVSKLRPSVIMDFVETIVGLTFVSEGELKKLVESATRLMGGATQAVETMTPSISGRGR